MSEPDNFISRWSRRKAAAADKDVAAVPETDAHAGAEQKESPASVPAEKSAATETEFDLSTLPSIESITSGTDISGFLKSGVPADLTRAALRRAWAADPNIRDFIGLSENSWDFTAPDGVPGFGPLSAEDAARIAAQFTSSVKEAAGKSKDAIERIGLSEPPADPVQSKLAPNETGQQAGDLSKQTASSLQDAAEQTSAPNADAANSLQRGREDIATQHEATESNDSQRTRRVHGRALPD